MSVMRATGMALLAGLGSAIMPADGTRVRGIPMPALLPKPNPKPVPGWPMPPSIAASATSIQ